MKLEGMYIVETSDLRMLVAEKGKHIRAINDVYEPEHIDEETGETIPEHFPTYSTVIYLGIQVKEEDILNLYIADGIE